MDDEPRISISDVTKKEGKKNQTTQFTFTVTLSAAYDQAVTMSFRTVGRHRQDERQRLRRQDRHADLQPRRDDEDHHDRRQGRQQEGGRRDVLPGPVRQQQQLAVHQEPRHRHDPERRLRKRAKQRRSFPPAIPSSSMTTSSAETGSSIRRHGTTPSPSLPATRASRSNRPADHFQHEEGQRLGQDHQADDLMAETLPAGTARDSSFNSDLPVGGASTRSPPTARRALRPRSPRNLSSGSS